MGGDLAVIRSAEENQFILDLLLKQKTVTWGGAWIGFQRNASDSKFYWIDGSPVEGPYQNWGSWEPNNQGNQENCGNMFGTQKDWNLRGKWNDVKCEVSESVPPNDCPLILCQKPI